MFGTVAIVIRTAIMMIRTTVKMIRMTTMAIRTAARMIRTALRMFRMVLTKPGRVFKTVRRALTLLKAGEWEGKNGKGTPGIEKQHRERRNSYSKRDLYGSRRKI